MVEKDEETPETLEETPTQVPEEKPQQPVTTVSMVSQQSKEVIFDIVTDETEADLKLDFTAPCWLSLNLGDQSLIPGENNIKRAGVFEQTIAGDQFGTLEFNVGDATAVKISVNNQVIDFEPSTPRFNT